MSKISIIWTGFGCADTLEASLAPWIEARDKRLGGNEFSICAVSVPFVGFDDCRAHDATHLLLNEKWVNREIDHIISHENPMKETAARGEALKWLVEKGITHIWQVDSDEFYTLDQIAAICQFVGGRPAIDWFRLSLRNLVFNDHTFLVDPFTPPRIHKIHNAGGYVAAGFYQDNNVYYERPWNREKIFDEQMSSVAVPKSVAWITHKSWMNDSRSRAKVEYQTARWGRCSFSWDDSQGGLIFNPALPIPETAQDE